jgi:F0F1-type ATP synthase assembly protein I
MREGLPDPKEMGRYLTISQVGMEMVAPIVLGLVLDYQFGWMPWATVIGAVLGLVAGISHLVVISNQGQKEKQSEGNQGEK